MMRIYIAGPMRGIENFNFQAFEDAYVRLRKQGLDVVSPHAIDIECGWVDVRGRSEVPLGDPFTNARRVFDSVELASDFSFEQAIRRDISEVTLCDALALLPGWEHSQGALIEKQVAEWCGIDILYLELVDGEWLLQRAQPPQVSVVA